MIKKLSLPERFNILFKVPKGTHITDKRVNYYTTKALKLQFPKLVPYHVDGEIFFDREFEVKVLPGALNTIYNPDGNHYFRK
jgi:diacylglycerol kinase family enzyme